MSKTFSVAGNCIIASIRLAISPTTACCPRPLPKRGGMSTLTTTRAASSAGRRPSPIPTPSWQHCSLTRSISAGAASTVSLYNEDIKNASNVWLCPDAWCCVAFLWKMRTHSYEWGRLLMAQLSFREFELLSRFFSKCFDFLPSDENYILTAAHCLDGFSSIEVVLGAHNITEVEPEQV